MAGLKRDAGAVGLLFASTTSMIGSGWLFGSFHAAKLAGPWSIVSWIIGAGIILLLALCFAELATVFPKSGAVVHMSHASHGAGLGRIWSWLLFLSYVAFPPVEAEAVLQYADNYLPYFIQSDTDGLLTSTGLVVAVFLVGLMVMLNMLAVRWLLAINSTITWWKIGVPLATIIGLMVMSFHSSNLTAAADSYDVSGIFIALPAAGIIFSFTGFRTAIELAGESSDPNRYMPLAVIGSVVIAGLIFIGLQAAFIFALTPEQIGGDWTQLSFSGDFGPFAGLATSLGMGWLAVSLYADAYVSPLGTGLMFATGGTRVAMANGETGAGPRSLAWLTPWGVPWASVLLTWVIGCLFLLPFPIWQKMVEYITSITVLTYGLGPVVLLCLRRNVPDLKRPFYLKGSAVIAPLAFISSNWIIYWAGFDTNSFLFGLIFIGFAVYAVIYHVTGRPASQFGWQHIAWLAPWFGGLWVFSALGDIDGGFGVLSFTSELIGIALWSLAVLWLAMRTSLNAQETRDNIQAILKADAGGEQSLL